MSLITFANIVFFGAFFLTLFAVPFALIVAQVAAGVIAVITLLDYLKTRP